MRIRKLVLVALIAFNLDSFARGQRPAPRIIEMRTGTADQVIGFRYTSQPFYAFPHIKGVLQKIGWPFFQKKIVDGKNLAKESAQRINDFINERGEYFGLNIHASNKTIYFITMNLGDENVTEALINAKKAGFKRVSIIVDGQSGLAPLQSIKGGVLENTNHENTRPKSNGMGEALKELLGEGFVINDLDSAYSIFTPNLRKQDMHPLQHMKAVILGIEGSEPASIFKVISPAYWIERFTKSRGSSSLHDQDASEPRYASYILTDNATAREDENWVFNRMFEILEPQLSRDQADHAHRVSEALAKTGEIEDIESLPPMRVLFPDSSFIQQSFSDGKFNTNEDLLEVFKMAERGELRIQQLFLSHYVLSMDSFVNELNKYMNQDPQTTITAVFDKSFVNGSGLAGTFAGMSNSSGDEIVCGLSPSACARIDAFVRRPEGETEKEGKQLWHDKLTVFKVVDAQGVTWYYFALGSANLTDRSKVNAELQFFGKLPASSPFAKWLIVSLKGNLKLQWDLFSPLERDALRAEIAKFVGLPPSQVTVDLVKSIEQALHDNQFAKVIEFIRQAYAKEESKLDGRELNTRVKMLADFFEWYRINIWPQKYYSGNPPTRHWWSGPFTDAKDWFLDQILFGRTKLRTQQLIPIFYLIAEREDNDQEIRQIQRLVNAISPDENFTPDAVETLTRASIKAMRIQGDYSSVSSEHFREATAVLSQSDSNKEVCENNLEEPAAKEKQPPKKPRTRRGKK